MTNSTTYHCPETVDEAIALMTGNAGFKYIAGGTDLLVNRYQGNDQSPGLIDLTGIQELGEIRMEDGLMKIGSLVTLKMLENSSLICREFPLLTEAASSVGSPLVRETATLGGNLLCENRCVFYNQSEWWREAAGFCLKCGGDICIATGGKKGCFSSFISDTAPALIVMDARIEIQDCNGRKVMPLEDVYTGDGISPFNLSSTAIITHIILPGNQQFIHRFYKLRQRKSLEFTSLTIAATLNFDTAFSLAISGIDPKPFVFKSAMDFNPGELIKEALKGARAVNNTMLSRNYRRDQLRLQLQKIIDELTIYQT